MRNCYWMRLGSLMLLVGMWGCTQTGHLQRMLIIKDYSENKDEQTAIVRQKNEEFRHLKAIIARGEISQLQTTDDFLREIGEPVAAFPKERKGKAYVQWLYRKTGTLKDTEKVYLYFNEQGVLEDWEHYIPHQDLKNARYRGGPG